MLPRNLISASLVLTAFVLSFFTNDKSIAEEKRKLNLEKDKVYEHVIKPILSANCTTCHGSSKAKGKIRLHNPEEIKKSESIVEGNIDESTLIERIMLPDDDEDVNLQLDDWHPGAQYDRVIPSRFSADSDDIFMRSMINSYAIDVNCAGKDDPPASCGKFIMSENTMKAAAREVLCTHKNLCGDALGKYLDTYWAKAWGHFDVNKSGSVAVERSPQFMRFLASDQRMSLQ